MMLAEVEGRCVAIGDCSGAFYQADLHEQVYVRPPPEAGEETGVVWKCLRAMPGLKGVPKAWDKHSTQKLTSEPLNMKQSKFDGCVFYDPAHGRRSGRHVDDFLVTGPYEKLEEQIDMMQGDMKMGEVVRLYEFGDKGTLIGLDLEKIEGGFAVSRGAHYVRDMQDVLGLRECKTAATPEVKSLSK